MAAHAAGAAGSAHARDTSSRREKSLATLSHELIGRYGREGEEIDLDEVQVCSARSFARSLAAAPPPTRVPAAHPHDQSARATQESFPNWKKRRLYDVMCICQCLHVVERTCKARFIWRGTAGVQGAIYDSVASLARISLRKRGRARG